jgi:hypothetical protein
MHPFATTATVAGVELHAPAPGLECCSLLSIGKAKHAVAMSPIGDFVTTRAERRQGPGGIDVPQPGPIADAYSHLMRPIAVDSGGAEFALTVDHGSQLIGLHLGPSPSRKPTTQKAARAGPVGVDQQRTDRGPSVSTELGENLLDPRFNGVGFRRPHWLGC